MDQYFSVKLDNGSSVDLKAAEELALQLHDSSVFRRDVYTDMGEFPGCQLWIAGEGWDGPLYLQTPEGAYLECLKR